MRESKVERRTCHTLVNFVFHGSDGRSASASSTLLVHVLSDGPDATPSFLLSSDSFEIGSDGEWKISRREGKLLPWA